ncbi:MAG: terpene synthase family protein [Pseudonocardiaceae bacterium]
MTTSGHSSRPAAGPHDDLGAARFIPGYFQIGNTVLAGNPLAQSSDGERDQVLGLARRALPRVASWAASYPLMGKPEDPHSRTAWACMYYAYAYPGGPVRQVADLTCLTLAIFAQDDILDGVVPGFSYERMAELSGGVHGLMDCPPRRIPPPCDPQLPPDGQVVAAYEDCHRRIAAYQAFAWARPYVARHWRWNQAAMLQESRWALGIDPAPALDAYLDNALASLHMTFIGAVEIAMSSLPTLPDSTLRAYDQALRLAALAGRLSNDIRTARREALEAGTNAVCLLMRSGATEQQAITTLRSAVTATIDDLDTAVRALPGQLARHGRRLLRRVRFVCDWYLYADSHGFSLRQLSADASAVPANDPPPVHTPAPPPAGGPA